MELTVAISNHKGGVAKTTTCVSLGACLAEAGHRTLLVDLDPQADLTLAVGLDAEGPDYSVVDLLDHTNPESTAKITEIIHATKIEGLDILPADPRLASVERLLYDQEDYEMLLSKILSPIQPEYDYILLDCPPSLGALTLMALSTAHSVLIPVQAEFYAARRLDRLLDVVDVVRDRLNQHLITYLVVTMYDQRNRICRGVLDQLRLSFSKRLLNTVIGVDTRLRESPAVGEPITMYAPRTRATKQYRELARELDNKIKQEKEK